MVEDRWFQKIVRVKELCMSANGLCVKELRVRKLCVKGSCEKLRVKELCVRKLACFFPHWVKVDLPSDVAGRSAITRMRTNRPMLLCVPARRISPSPLLSYLVTNQAFAQSTQVRAILHHRPPRWQATIYQPDWHRGTRHDMKRSRDVYWNNTQRTHAQRRENKRCQCFFRKSTLTHSCHTSICFVAVTWDQLQSGPQSDTEQDETEPPPPGTAIGETYHDEQDQPPDGSNNSWPCRQANCGTGNSAPASLRFPGPSYMRTVTAALLPQSEKGWMFYSMLWTHDDVVSCVNLHWGPACDADNWWTHACFLPFLCLVVRSLSFLLFSFSWFVCLSFHHDLPRCRSWFLQCTRL